MIVSRGMGVVGKGPGLAQNALFHFPLGYTTSVERTTASEREVVIGPRITHKKGRTA